MKHFENRFFSNIRITDKTHSTQLLSTVLDCDVNGSPGNGESRGSCDQYHFCQANGECTPECEVSGGLGDGTERGSCKVGEVCLKDRKCFPGNGFRKAHLKNLKK